MCHGIKPRTKSYSDYEFFSFSPISLCTSSHATKRDWKRRIMSNKKSNCISNSSENDSGSSGNVDGGGYIVRQMRNLFKTVPIPSSTDYRPDMGQQTKFEPYYNMNHKHRGLALIFNHEKYDAGVKDRNGTQFDRDRLQETFYSLEFDVRIYDDFKINQILDTLDQGTNLSKLMNTNFCLEF